MPLYVYGVVRAGTPVPEGDYGLGPVSALVDGDLAAVCSTVGDEPVGRRRELKAHADVLAELAREHAVVPFRFGTVLPDDDAVRDDVLGRRSAHLLRELERLADVVQMAVRLVPDEDLLIADVMAASPDLRRLDERVRAAGQGRDHGLRLRLGEGVAHRYREWVERLSAAAVDALAEHAVDVRVPGERGVDAPVRADLLVRRADVRDFLADGERVAASMHGRLQCRITGPLAPFSFVDGAQETGPALSGAR